MSKGADFQLSDNVNKNNVFLINLSEIEGRLDASFYEPKLFEIEKIVRSKSNKKLHHFAMNMGSGATPDVSNETLYANENTGFPLLRVQNLTSNGTLNLKNLKYITSDVHEGMLKRSQVTESDLLVKITGVGRMAVASVPPRGFVGNTNQHMVVIKTGDRTLSEYLANYLNLDIIEKLASRRATGGTRPALDYTALRSIPVIDNLDFSFLEQGKQKANSLKKRTTEILNSINDYLLTELGISVPEVDNALANRMFYTKLSTLNQRLDPTYYFNNKTQVEGGIYENILLKNIVNFTKGSSITSDIIIEGDYPVIAGGQTSPYNHNTYNFSGETITISASGAYSGYVWYHDYPIFASDCTVLTIRNKKIALIQYIFEILKLKQQEIYKLQKGAGQPHVYANDLAKIQIPLPDLPKQQEIVNHINQLRAKAKELEQQAEEILHTTNQQIEKMILGEVQ